MTFEEGERYRQAGVKDVDAYVVGIREENDKGILLAIFWTAQGTGTMLNADELMIKKEDYGKWTKVEDES